MQHEEDIQSIGKFYKSVPDEQHKCYIEDNLITFEPYTNESLRIYVKYIGQDKFYPPRCMDLEELTEALKTTPRSHVFYVGQRTETSTDSGRGVKPTNTMVIKMNIGDLTCYISKNSIKRIIQEKSVKKWYLVPLYNEKRKRITNYRGRMIISGNHGQIPGYHVFNAYTRQELLDGVDLSENIDTNPPVENLGNTFIEGLVGTPRETVEPMSEAALSASIDDILGHVFQGLSLDEQRYIRQRQMANRQPQRVNTGMDTRRPQCPPGRERAPCSPNCLLNCTLPQTRNPTTCRCKRPPH